MNSKTATGEASCMPGGTPTNDVWARTTNVDQSALAVMAERLESRAKHPFFRGVIADYIADLELERIQALWRSDAARAWYRGH